MSHEPASQSVADEPPAPTRRGWRRPWVLVVALLATASVVAGAAFVPGALEDDPCPDGTVSLTVAADPAIAAAVRDVATGVPCTSYDVVDAPSAAGPPAGAGAWIPDSSVWLAPEQAATATSVATTPVVLALTADPAVPATDAERSDQAGATPTPSAAGAAPPVAVVDTEILGSDVRLAVPETAGSAAAVGALGALLTTSRSDPGARAALLAAVRGAASLGPVDDARLLATLTRGRTVPTAEQAVWAHNAAGTGSPLVAAYPAHGGYVLDFPFVVLASDPAARRAADQLLAGLQADRGVAALAARGFRTPDGEFPAVIDPTGIDPTFRAGRVPVDAAVRDQVAAALDTAARPSRMLAVIDVSGSMGEPVDESSGLTRIDVVAQAATGALAVVPPGTAIGLWEFSTRLDGRRDYRELVPVGPLDGTVGKAPRDELLAREMSRLAHIPGGATGLYDTTLAAVRAMRAGFDPDAVNSVVLLTDGRNDDRGSISLRRLVRTLQAEAAAGPAVPVIALAYGPDADVAALQQIAEATGGKVYRAPRVREVGEVFLDAVGQRLCRPDC
jgi:hypothetical protein